MSSNPKSTLTPEGASKLAVTINKFWGKLGLSAGARVEQEDTDGHGSHAVRVVRSDMINGLPRAEYFRRAEIARQKGFFKLSPLPLSVIPRPGSATA